MGLTSVSKQLFSLLLCLLLNNRLQYSPPFLLAAILEKSENTENTSDVSNVIREYIWLLGKYRHCIMPSNTADVSDTFMRQNTYGEFQIQNTYKYILRLYSAD